MINFIKGDATSVNKADGLRIICHVCNNVGGFGSGFAGVVADKWPTVRDKYKAWHKKEHTYATDMPLGEIQVVPIEDKHGRLFIANMVAQKGYATRENPVALKYQSLYRCLRQLDRWIKAYVEVYGRWKMECNRKVPDISIHMPRIGCGLAGGDWDKVELLLGVTVSHHDVFVYDLE
jgi:O-acetyl-ADP-ribose deacetylase (regulator of RNase III)